ncbi:hypothetical protein GQ54DRAFT_300221 [Martensiomyces pterosporus]|nr:hypothetical protein GQ54DRAFT_300221 [Martensiomyces pterosporus]
MPTHKHTRFAHALSLLPLFSSASLLARSPFSLFSVLLSHCFAAVFHLFLNKCTSGGMSTKAVWSVKEGRVQQKQQHHSSSSTARGKKRRRDKAHLAVVQWGFAWHRHRAHSHKTRMCTL